MKNPSASSRNVMKNNATDQIAISNTQGPRTSESLWGVEIETKAIVTEESDSQDVQSEFDAQGSYKFVF